MLIVKYETPTLWAGEEYFELFMRLISFCEAIFDSAILQAPTASEAPIRTYIYKLVSKAWNRFEVLRQSPTKAVLPVVRMPTIFNHNLTP